MNTPAKSRILLLAGALLLAASPAHTANINWSAANNIAGDSDISLKGDLVYAVNFGGIATGNIPIDVTINGVIFGGGNQTAGQQGRYTMSGATNWGRDYTGRPDSAPFKNLSADYQNLLQSYVGHTTNTTSPITVTLQNLSVGQLYEVQIWVNNSRYRNPSGNPIQQAVVISGGIDTDSVTLLSNVTDATGDLGQYIIGTFTADATTQMLTIVGDHEGIATPINALQLRAIPEAGTCALLFAGFAAATILLRRKARR